MASNICSPSLQGFANIEDGYCLLELQEHEGVCRGCVVGKNAKGSFPSSDCKSKGILDLVHSYVCRPMTISSFGGFLYYVTFIILPEDMGLVHKDQG